MNMRVMLRGLCVGWTIGLVALALVAVVAAVQHAMLPPTLYVCAFWGIGNRLQTVRVAYDLAAALNRRLVFVDRIDAGMGSSRLTDLVDLPVDGVLHHQWQVPLFHKAIRSNGNGVCSLTMPLSEIQKVTHRALLISACALNIEGLRESGEFYKRVRIKPSLATEVEPLLQSLRARQCVGIHIRQGSLSDYTQKYFFGKWTQEPGRFPTECCDTSKKDDAVTCPQKAVVLDRFIEKMRAYPSDTAFYVASDRPLCVDRLTHEFPGRVVHIPPHTEQVVDARRGMTEFLALSQCRELVVSSVSSFSREAAKIHGIRCITLSSTE